MPEKSARMLATLERLLAIPVGDLEMALVRASDCVAETFTADKVDVFLHDATRDSLVAVGSSTQPLSATQKRLGLDVLAIANGGRIVEAFVRGLPYVSGAVDADPEELRGVRDGLGVRSCIAVALAPTKKPRGVLAIASQRPHAWDDDDARLAESVARWVSLVLHQAELVEEIAATAVARGRQIAAEELVTILAHDLRNCLYPADLALHLVEERAARDERREDVREGARIRKALGRLQALVSDILDVSRLERGVLHARLERTDLGALVRDAASLMQTDGHPVIVLSAEPLWANVDPGRIRQCLENLLANAIRHSPKNAAVDIVASIVDGGEQAHVRIEVVDRGPGVPPELAPFLFDRYVRGRESGAGLGLGLFLGREIARVHGGDLIFESTPDKGARFVLTLPCERGGTDLDGSAS